VRSNDVPYHELFDHGYASIGCAPCTRPIQPGESERAGRWWWESETDKECGIHCSVGLLGSKTDAQRAAEAQAAAGLSAAEASGLSAAGGATDDGQAAGGPTDGGWAAGGASDGGQADSGAATEEAAG
jgi:hypothetical protein